MLKDQLHFIRFKKQCCKESTDAQFYFCENNLGYFGGIQTVNHAETLLRLPPFILHIVQVRQFLGGHTD
jgi:hypothetical protein